MKIKEGEIKVSRGWWYKEIQFQLEKEICQLSFLEGGEIYENCTSNTIQRLQRKDKNS